jgi:hypothetical protein
LVYDLQYLKLGKSKSGDRLMMKLILLGIILIVSLTLSCASRVSDLERATSMSNNIYNDIAPQVATALKASSTDGTRAERLRLIDRKLDEYRKAYDECIKAIDISKSTGQSPNPENTKELYEQMWKPLIDAVTLASTLYIYPSECAARTAVKGKACQ